MKLPPHFLLIPIIAALTSCAVPPVNLEGRKISRLDVVYEGRKTVDENRLRQFIESKPGASYSPALISEDIRRLFYTGLIDDVQIHAEPAGHDEVNLQFKVTTPRPLGSPLSFSGNHAFRDLILVKASGLKVLPESEADTLKAITRLEKFYHRRGYPHARITVRRTRDQGVTSHLCFEITEGPLR
jgi:outer membrane protein insertion porin family